jgi:hypothetical protein
MDQPALVARCVNQPDKSGVMPLYKGWQRDQPDENPEQVDDGRDGVVAQRADISCGVEKLTVAMPRWIGGPHLPIGDGRCPYAYPASRTAWKKNRTRPRQLGCRRPEDQPTTSG